MAVQTIFYVSGPALIFAKVGPGDGVPRGTPANNTWLHIGYSEGPVRVTSSPMYRPVQADVAGDMPYDQEFMGEDIYVTVRFSTYYEQNLRLCKQRLNSSFSTAPGSGIGGSIGQLVVQGGNSYSFAVISPYFVQDQFNGGNLPNANSAQSMIPGYYIPNSYMADTDDRELGSRYKVEQAVFRSIGSFTNNGGYVLYYDNKANFPADLLAAITTLMGVDF